MTRAKDISKILTDADISGNIDVDGVTNLDVVDIDGAVNMATTALVTGVLTTTAVPLFNGGIDLPTVNTFIKGGGHNVVQVDSTKTYLYGGTGGVQFRTADNASGIVDITNAGAVTVANGLTLTDGNLVVASGHGIDFGATGNVSGTSSELLDDYEEGVLLLHIVSLQETLYRQEDILKLVIWLQYLLEHSLLKLVLVML